uniref:Uncharacterized protein n=1 Tax=Opuntia streptacantha TaxID=393608 RepID=A0A7C8ZC27_OPUST
MYLSMYGFDSFSNFVIAFSVLHGFVVCTIFVDSCSHQLLRVLFSRGNGNKRKFSGLAEFWGMLDAYVLCGTMQELWTLWEYNSGLRVEEGKGSSMQEEGRGGGLVINN